MLQNGWPCYHDVLLPPVLACNTVGDSFQQSQRVQATVATGAAGEYDGTYGSKRRFWREQRHILRTHKVK